MGDEELVNLPATSRLSAAALSKLRWRCRRGLLENDLFIERFFNRHAHDLSVEMARGMYALMALSDNDLLDILLNRPAPLQSAFETETLHVRQVLELSEVQALLPLLRT